MLEQSIPREKLHTGVMAASDLFSNQFPTIAIPQPACAGAIFGYDKNMSIEKPTYQVLRKNGPFEIRRYDPYITSQVIVKANNARQAASIGFSPLGNYIFGANTSRQKIAMTAPVAAQSRSEKIAMTAPVSVTGEGTYTVSFTIPSKYTLASLPIPNDERVHFVQHPPQTFAAVRFSGPFQQPNFDKHTQKLRAWMAENGLQPAGDPVIAGYNAPITPNFLKHNEILIKIK